MPSMKTDSEASIDSSYIPALSGDGMVSRVTVGALQKYGDSTGTRGIKQTLSYIII